MPTVNYINNNIYNMILKSYRSLQTLQVSDVIAMFLSCVAVVKLHLERLFTFSFAFGFVGVCLCGWSLGCCSCVTVGS